MPQSKIEIFKEALLSQGNPHKAASALGFFKTGPGGYGEGDTFWGNSVPSQRATAKQFYNTLNLDELAVLITDPVHEVRLTTLFMLVLQFQKAKDEAVREAIAKLYLAKLDYVNNWDLVDSSAHLILGEWYWGKSHEMLFTLAKSDHLWRQRVAVIATYTFIRKGLYQPTLELAELLLNHKHDLIHKAVGWMLREIGNRDYQVEYDFLKQHYTKMPRTMLRYAIEKFAEPVRQQFLKGDI